MFGKLSGEKDGMMYHESNKEDPYLTEGGAAMEDSDEEDDEEDTAIKASDMLIATTRCEEVSPAHSPACCAVRGWRPTLNRGAAFLAGLLQPGSVRVRGGAGRGFQ